MGISTDELLSVGADMGPFIDALAGNADEEVINWYIKDKSSGLDRSYIQYMVDTVDRLDDVIDLDFTLVSKSNRSMSDINVRLVDYDGQDHMGLARLNWDESSQWTALKIVDYSSMGVSEDNNKNTFIHELGHALGLAEPGFENRWDQDDTAMSYNKGDSGWQTWYTESDLNALISIWGPEDDQGPPLANIVSSVVGKGKLWGSMSADQFLFDNYETFGGQSADKIIAFDSFQGDKIVVSVDAMPSLSGADEISFSTANTKRELRHLSKSDFDLVYFEPKGRLFANGNGHELGWGDSSEGGLMAIFKGKPELNATDFVLLT